MKAYIISIFLFVVAITVTLLVLQTGGRHSLTTNTSSSQFDSDEKKIAFLRKYLILHSKVETTEFHIIYHDNSGGFPGPSDWYIVAAIKILPADINDWIKDMLPQSEKIDISWGYNLLPNLDTKWKVTSSPKIYSSSGGRSVVAVFQPEGIIFKRIQTN